MTRLESYIKKKKLIIFDLDGVLIDSRNNMRSAWQYVRRQNNLITPFEDYFKYVGLPFKEILKKINLRFCSMIKLEIIIVKNIYSTEYNQ